MNIRFADVVRNEGIVNPGEKYNARDAEIASIGKMLDIILRTDGSHI